jgi:hypothetical protein
MTRNSDSNASRRLSVAMRIGAIACAAAATLSAPPLAAHHSFAAEFDSAKEIKVTGEVSKLEWMNPHAWIHVGAQQICERPGGRRGSDEPEASWTCRTPGADEAADWGFELASPNGLMRQGWNRNSLKPGDEVTIEGTRARDGSEHANARVVTMGDGKRLFAGSSENAAP